jgi:hypothetical protein
LLCCFLSPGECFHGMDHSLFLAMWPSRHLHLINMPFLARLLCTSLQVVLGQLHVRLNSS